MAEISSLAAVMRDILLANELGGNTAAAYRFVDCDGKSGRSGFSFGISQFDITHNPAAAKILGNAGFTAAEIAALKAQTVTPDQLHAMNARLLAAHVVIDSADLAQSRDCITHVLALPLPYLLPGRLLFHLADYHNQFYLARDGKCHTWLQEHSGAPTPEQFLQWKLTSTAWGTNHGDDVRRRWNNVQRVLDAHAIQGKP